LYFILIKAHNLSDKLNLKKKKENLKAEGEEIGDLTREAIALSAPYQFQDYGPESGTE